MTRSGKAVLSRSGAWGCAGLVVGTLVAATVWAPARWLGHAVHWASGGQVQLHNAEGRLWQGSAALVLHSPDRALALPSRVHWRMGLQGLGLTAQLQSACCTPAQPVQLRLSPSGIQVAALQLQLPLAWLQALGTPWNTLGLRGQLQVRSEGLQLAPQDGRWQAVGQWQATAHGVGTALSTLPEVGSYRLRWTPQGVQLETLRGALQLQGQGQWGARGLHFEGWAQARPERAAELANLLTLLGDKRGDKTKIRWGNT